MTQTPTSKVSAAQWLECKAYACAYTAPGPDRQAAEVELKAAVEVAKLHGLSGDEIWDTVQQAKTRGRNDRAFDVAESKGQTPFQ